MRAFLSCLGAALVSKGLRGLLGEIPLGGVLCDVCEDVWVRWKEQQQTTPIQKELQQVTGASREQMATEVDQIVKKVAADQPQAVQEKLKIYINSVPGTLRSSFRRPEDTRGMTVPSSFTFSSSIQLVTVLPGHLPRFKVGDRPLLGVPLQLTELLGVGGFGEVWKAEDVQFKGIAPVALKFCLDPSAAKSLRHEAGLLDQVMKQGGGKGIVTLKRAYLEADPICLEYEYVAGGDLTGLIHKIQKMPAPKRIELSRQIIRQLADVVGRMHRLSPPVIHRDLKPANVLTRLTPEGKSQLLVADFGIGGIAAEKQVEGERYGTTTRGDLLATIAHGSCTPLYASPQQKAGERPDPRDDVHALGVMWYQLLMGDPTHGIAADYADDLRGLGVEETEIRLLGSCVAAKAPRRPADGADLAAQISNLLHKVEETVKTVTDTASSTATEVVTATPGEKNSGASEGDDKTTNEPWNGEFYCNYGDGENRLWADAVQYGFICAGGGAFYSRTLQLLSPGDRVWVKAPGRGFVGVGRVMGRAQPATTFKLATAGGDVPVLEIVKGAKYHREFLNDPERCEYFVPVRWLQTVPLEQGVNESGLFGNQNTICKPTAAKWRSTVERLKEKFPDFDKDTGAAGGQAGGAIAEVAKSNHEIRWTEKKIALLQALSNLGATGPRTAVTVQEAIKASEGKALTNVIPQYDMTVQGYIAWTQFEDEKFKRIFITPKGEEILKANKS